MSLHKHPQSPLLDHCPPTLPAQAYLERDWYEAERRTIWAGGWIHVGRSSRFKPGTMRRIAFAGHNVIVCRDGQGGLKAFHNVCRHRGAELCSVDEKPFGKLIVCPYHNWSYSADGKLVSVAHATPGDDFSKADLGLLRVHAMEWNGFVFVCLAENPPPFAPDTGLDALDNWPMTKLVAGHRSESRLACNWKIFWENYNECLHCPGVHPELCDRVPIYGRGIMSAPEAPGWTPEQPAEQVLKSGTRSWTPDGGACGPEFAGLTAAQRAAGFHFTTILPSLYIVAHVDHVRAVTLTPLGPEEMLLTAEWLFPAETLAQPGFDAADVASFASLVMQQDAEVCEMNQRGLKSGAYQSGTLMPQEFDIHHFHNWIRARMGA
ncbi:MAG: aromatic ring-hydroxylating dioxygenase subunit alpha [Rhizobiaceae bacterium]